MKKTILYFVLLISACFYSQIKLDSVQVNQFKSTQIIFNDEEVKFVESGTSDLQVNHKIIENVLIIQSVVSKDEFLHTNLFIKTDKGIYNCILYYGDSPNNYVVFSDKLNMIGNLANNNSYTNTPRQNKGGASTTPLKTNTPNKVKSTEQANIDYIISSNKIFKPSKEFITGVAFQFYAHYVENGKFYFKFKIDNNSELNYNMGDWYFNIRSNKKRKTTISQRPIAPSDFIVNPSVVNAKSSEYIIIEFPAFSLNKSEEFIVEIDEQNGERDFLVGIPFYVINKPYTIKK